MSRIRNLDHSSIQGKMKYNQVKKQEVLNGFSTKATPIKIKENSENSQTVDNAINSFQEKILSELKKLSEVLNNMPERELNDGYPVIDEGWIKSMQERLDKLRQRD